MCEKTNRCFRWVLVAVFATLLGVLSFSAHTFAATGINPQISFEGKIVTAGGVNIPDGTYNLEFKIYQDGTNTGTGSTLKWTEDRLVSASNGVTVKSGTFQVNLGSITAFGSNIDWNQSVLWLSMNVGGTGSTASWDGEMTPYIRLTAVPYAMNAGTVGGLAASQLVQLSPGAQQTGTINVSGNITSGAVITGGSLVVGGTTAFNTSGQLQAATVTGSYAGITGVGTLTAGTWNASTLTAAYGGTGQSGYTVGDLLYASSATALSKLSDVATGSCLISGGVGVAPTWGACGSASSSANTALSNLASVAINTSLLPGTTNAIDAGSSTLGFRSGYFATSIITPTLQSASGVLGIDTGNAAALTIGGTNANAVSIGRSATTTTVQGALAVTGNTTHTGTTTLTGLLTANSATLNGALTTNGQNTANFSANSSGSGAIYNVTNSNTSATPNNLSGLLVAPVGTANTSATNTTNGLRLQNVTAVTGNVFNGIYAGTGYNSILNYNGNTVLDGTASTLTLGQGGSTSGALVLNNSSNSNAVTIKASTSQANALALTIPTDANATDTLCLQTLANCGVASGSGNYIQNGTSQQVANFNILGVNATSPVVTIQAASSQHGTSFQVLSNSGNATLATTGDGNVAVGNALTVGNTTTVNGAYLSVTNAGATAAPLLGLKETAGQTGDLQQFLNSSNTLLGGFNAAGRLYLQTGSYAVTLNTATQANNIALNIPADTNTTDTLCLQTLANCGVASGSGNYIQNTTTQQASSNFNISGAGVVGSTLTAAGLVAPSLQSASGNLSIDTGSNATLSLGAANASTINLGPSGAVVEAATINIGTTTGAAQDINIGGSGNTNGSNANSTTSIQAGSSMLLVSGSGTTIQSSTSSTTAFQVQNAAGVPLFLVDTSTNLSGNYLTNGGFELGTTTPTYWSPAGAPTTFSRNVATPNHYGGQASLQLVTTATAGQGATTSGTGFISSTPANGTYTLSFYAQVTSGAMTSGEFQTSVNGGTAVACTAGVTLSASGFQRVFCPITISATLTSLSIQQSTATARTLYIDAVQLVAGSNATPAASAGAIQLRGTIDSPVVFQALSNSTTAFQIQDKAATTNLFVADTLDTRIGINTTGTPSATLSVGGTTGNFTVTAAGAVTATSLQIGSITANTNGYLAVLNNYSNTTTEPTPVTGAMYYNSYMGQFRCGVAGAWVSCGGLTISNTAASACTVSTTATACVPNNFFTGAAPTIPANYCSAGRTIHVIVNGLYSQTTASQTMTFSIRLAGVVIGAASNTMVTSSTAATTNAPWQLDFWITCNSTTTVTGEGWARLSLTGAGGAANTTTFDTQPMAGTGATTVTNTSAQAIAPYINWGAATAGNAATIQQFIVQAE